MSASKKSCATCQRADCPGMEQLREYLDWSDLVNHCGEDTIVEWVNELFEMKEKQARWSRRYRYKQQALAKLGQEMLEREGLTELPEVLK